MDSVVTEITVLDSRERRSGGPFFLELSQDEGSNRMRVLNRWYDAGGFSAGTAQGFNEQFMEVFRELGQIVVEKHSLELDEGLCRAFLTDLAEIGAAAYNARFLEEVRSVIFEYEKNYAHRGLSLSITIPNSVSVFWEMMYSGAFQPNIETSREWFWGLRYPLGRMHWGPHPYDTVYVHRGALPILDEDLNHAQQEKESLGRYLAELADELGADWQVGDPQDLLPEDQAATALLALFCDAGYNYGLLHFACHLVTPPGSAAAQAYLRFSSHKRQWKLKLQKLQATSGSGGFQTCHPLVFLNACASSTSGYLDEMLSFPLAFLSLGAGGIIATACPVPDIFARAFSDEFYRRLFNRSHLNGNSFEATVADVLLETRKHFLQEFNNPLGLAYGLHAMSKQRLFASKRTRPTSDLKGPGAWTDPAYVHQKAIDDC